MNLAKNLKSVTRHAVNMTTRTIIRNEALRKLLVEKYYRKIAEKLNSQGQFAWQSAEDLLDWRMTMNFRIKCSHEVYRANSFYGIGEALRAFSGSTQCIKACIEHGVYFGAYVNEQELHKSGLPCLITFGSARYDHIREVSDVPVIMVGPYIAYAKDYLKQEEFITAKEKLGKTLLVFPSHSIDRVKVSYELSSLFAEMEHVKTMFGIKSILVCLYYRDLLNGVADIYEQKGYSVVTAGYREDSLFLPRLRSLIKLSDLTMSNSVGTHVGYCAYMGKPHYVFDQLKGYSSDSILDSCEYKNVFLKSQTLEKNEVAKLFSGFEKKLTRQQENVMDRYWGFKNIKSPLDMSVLLDVCEKAWSEKTKHRQRSFREMAIARGLLANDGVNDAD